MEHCSVANPCRSWHWRKNLGVSKTPVREALLELKRQGLVEIHPQRGTFVFEMSSDQVVQLAEDAFHT